MRHSLYDAFEDEYCYKGTNILKNKANIKEQDELNEFEHAMFTLAIETGIKLTRIDSANLTKLHRHLFKDIYPWAGKFRKVRIGKDGNWFCFPEYIETELDKLFAKVNAVNLTEIGRDKLIELATDFLAELNAIHPFREGNGRTQNLFVAYLTEIAGYKFDLENINPQSFLSAMVSSFNGNNSFLQQQLNYLII